MISVYFIFFTTGVKAQDVEEIPHEHETDSVVMTHAFSRYLPMSRTGPGTSWLPDETPVYAYMDHFREWSLMLHGNLFIRYNHQDITQQGERGDDMVDAPNWIMGMVQRKTGRKGLLMFRTMLSLEPATVGGAGYPLLFQTGETWQGEPLIDRQHPHHFFSEIAAAYSYMLSEDMDLSAYAGYPGAPALGPPAFMHRISDFSNPSAPLGHHWQDATHITFGVITTGFRYKIVKIEGSIFTGREPGENYYGFDRPRFDSYSYRVSVNPQDNIALQFSQGFLKSPEVLHPDRDIIRTSASLIHSVFFRDGDYWTSSLVWGVNAENGELKMSGLFETRLQLKKAGIYGRYEWVEKSSEDLSVANFKAHELLPVTAFSAGAEYVISSAVHTRFAAGAQGSLFITPNGLISVYGPAPMSLEIFLHFSPNMLAFR